MYRFAPTYTTAISGKSLEKCFPYSENPSALQNLFGNIDSYPRSLEIEYLNTGIRKHFPEDKEPRQTLSIRITRNRKEIEFTFGMSLNDTETIEALNKNYSFGNYTTYHGKKYSPNENQKRSKDIISDFKELKETILYTLLSCIKSDFFIDPIFEDFCSEFGYDPDSRKAFSLWQSCLEQSQKLHSIFTEEEVNSFPS